MFQAQTWEVDLGKALDLKPGERLERRSGLFQLPGAGELVRLDRVYRLGGARSGVAKPAAQGVGNAAFAAQGVIAAPVATAMPSPATAPTVAGTLAAAVDPTVPLNEGGGELVWANAMIADRLMVQVESGVTREQLASRLPGRTQVLRPITRDGLYLVEVPADGERSVERAVLALKQLKGVIKFAEPDFLLTSADTTANDPLFTANAADLTKQWHLAKTMAPRAWDVIKAPPTPAIGDSTVVAIVDTGIDYTHPDLAAAMWTNPGETGGTKESNGLDDDANGKVDDWRGWDFIDNDNDPMDDVGHGTHVAGII